MSGADQLDFARYAARLRWGRATAWRTGAIVGELGLVCSNPYPFKSRSFDCFEQGISYGCDKASPTRGGGSA